MSSAISSTTDAERTVPPGLENSGKFPSVLNVMISKSFPRKNRVARGLGEEAGTGGLAAAQIYV